MLARSFGKIYLGFFCLRSIHITASTINIQNMLNIQSISYFYKEIYHATWDEIAGKL
jgi:hypothetical protein